MQTLRKKTSPLKYKNETTRFLGDGVCFKAKLIGILEVSEARGDRMCQEALSDLKMAIRAAGEHKQRITIHIALDGLRLRDEKTGDSLYHHPVHKISFIAQDMTDSRAFGYIFGAPDTGHRFFGIKTDKAASQVVIAMRDLFQVVFALKKKEIELAKIHLEKTRYPTSPIFSGEGSTSKLSSQDKTSTETKSSGAVAEAKTSGTAVADLVDLELELNSLQQGLNQMERITPSDPFGSKDDPFGDSFISYPKPILPPPPSSGRERSSRTSESSSIFSPKTPHTTVSLDNSSVATGDSLTTKKDFSFSHDFSTSHDEPSSGDWFTPSAGNSLFEDPPLVPPEPQKDDKHELQKQEILSQFDVFTELDPLGTGRSKPYIDKKHFFQELKNPPKKVLNDLVSSTTTQGNQNAENLFANFNQNKNNVNAPSGANGGAVTSVFSADPFGEDPFVKEDPFAEADFSKQDPFENDFNDRFKDQFDKFKFDFNNRGSSEKSPKYLEKQMSVGISGTSPKTVQFQKQNTFDVQYDKFDDRKFCKLSQLHENPSLDMSSESECAPEPPPRPQSSLMQIKPPPLPPKKQNDLAVRPPPRPPHSEESHYDYMDNYETSTTEYKCLQDKSPPLPVPARKSKFESDFNAPAPERPKKNFNLQYSSEEDYLQPVGMEKSAASGILLPPPQKSKKHNLATMQTTVSSYLENKPQITTSHAQISDKDPSLEGLDITLSQLTLSGLNELAQKLNIPPSQLSNMTLVQLTNYLSNFIRTKAAAKPHSCTSEHANEQFATFQADFASNFSNSTTTTTADTSYDRYAVFRELIQEEIKQTKIDTEPEQLKEEQKLENNNDSNASVAINNLNISAIKNDETVDKYAALRDIEIEIKQDDVKIENVEQETEKSNNETIIEENMNKENKLNSGTLPETKNYIEEYNNANIEKVQQPVSPKSPQKIKSPIPSAVSEIIQSNTRLNSGSLSDVVSGSSPEVDNTNNSDRDKKIEDATGESWAIFDQGNNGESHHKQVQSEEGVSPWSSDSKEFGNGSPPEYRRHERRPGSGGRKDDKEWKRRRDQEGWWDTSAEPEGPYYASNRRSNDSYDEEYYECYDRPRRRRPANWSSTAAAGGHSSSSRDVSPWEEEPRRRDPREGSRDGRWSAGRHTRGPSFDRHKDRRRDSWEDEEEDYEYDDERERYHWSERHGNRESDRDRHSSTGSRDRDHDGERWDERSEDRRHRRRREMGSRDRWCCPDWEQGEHEKGSRYGSGRWSGEGRRGGGGGGGDRKPEPRYYSRDSQESPWEDEYSNGPEDAHNYYLSTKRYGKPRPSSASEMDRKTGEIKSRHNLGGSDGERDRRYKSNRRSRSRDSQYSEPPHRHPKPEAANASRQIRKSHHKTEVEKLEAKLDLSKKCATLSARKKKESPKSEESCSTFPRKSSGRNSKSPFENDFVPTPDEEVPTSRIGGAKFNFEDFETSEAESPTIARPMKETRIKSPRYSSKKSLFEDDFSPSDKVPEVENISSIKEESDVREEEDTFSDYNTTTTNNNNNSTRKKILAARLGSVGGGRVGQGDNLKKSESVNIFTRENDPFDDDFFSGTAAAASGGDGERPSPRTTELRWTRDFQNFDVDKK